MKRIVADLRQFSHGEEIANSVIHGTGVVLSIMGLIFLAWQAGRFDGGLNLVVAAIYGGSLVLLYSSSTLYHSLSKTRAKRIFQIIDHSAIYLLIAGSFTPFVLILLGGTWGWIYFSLAWAIAGVGVVSEVFWRRPKWLSVLIYIGISLLIVSLASPILFRLPPVALQLLVAGGALYIIGTVFYVFKRVPYFHMVWHLLVLAASICHWCVVMFFVISN